MNNTGTKYITIVDIRRLKVNVDLAYHTLYIKLNNKGTKYLRIKKQTAFLREKNGEYIPCLKYSVPIFVE